MKLKFKDCGYYTSGDKGDEKEVGGEGVVIQDIGKTKEGQLDNDINIVLSMKATDVSSCWWI
ncbi:conserved hypothetical protein [Ricinus communis]|uniref:Uncharacterized protein n=1 Tax=Ricinus communis TaxID=3988 RepID=B9SQF5_RICCO|nr:conserved hypothetical protein [Ricinus communis]